MLDYVRVTKQKQQGEAMKAIVNDCYHSALVDGKRPVTIFVNGNMSCLVMADEFLMLSEIRLAYAQYTGFDINTVTCGNFGLNILGMELRP